MHETNKHYTRRYLVALSVAGSDPSGGAGIQADMKTFASLGVYGSTAITAVTVQNTQGVQYVHPLPPQVVYDQIVAVMDDLCPDVVKVGMVNDAATLEAVISAFGRCKPRFVVVDPVMVASHGCALMKPEAEALLKERLLPMAALLTPNLPEACRLSGMDIKTDADTRLAAGRMLDFGARSVLVKGGHTSDGTKTDMLFMQTAGGIVSRSYTAETVETRNTHGTGCTLSSAIAAYVARGLSVADAIEAAKAYLTEALRQGADVAVGHGIGPVNHGNLIVKQSF